MTVEEILKPKPDKPVSPEYASLIGSVLEAADKIGTPVFIVGAMARIILLEHVHGLRTGRTTTDIDFAVAVPSWEAFSALKNELICTYGFERHQHKKQRLMKIAGPSYISYIVDLVPFGQIEEDQAIAWPPDLDIIMTVAGYLEGLETAARVEIYPDMVIRIASVPSLAIMKVFAWADRREEGPKDAQDLLQLLQQYSSAGNEDRLFQQPCVEVLNKLEHNWELAGAWLLGHDVGAISRTDTRGKLLKLLEGELRRRLITDMARSMPGDVRAYDIAEIFLEQFNQGIRAYS